MCPPTPAPFDGGPSAPAVPQMFANIYITSLSVPVLASVGGDCIVRHTRPPASHTSCLPCVPSAV
eukprot:scaffold12927_cov45-Isochrysis_galbana.AAC.1